MLDDVSDVCIGVERERAITLLVLLEEEISYVTRISLHLVLNFSHVC